MKKVLLTVSVIILLLVSYSWGLDFKITKVIDIGPIFSGPMVKPIQFSPDGQWLAYMNNNQLYLADSNGVSHTVCDIEMIPYSFEWMNNQEILLFHLERLSSRTDVKRLTKINITTGEKEILEEYTHKIFEDDTVSFTRPELTVEGNVFYYKERYGEKSVKLPVFPDNNKSALSSNHILRTGDDALYLVKADMSDSVKISNKRYEGYMGSMPLLLSKDRTHIMFGGSIVRLADDYLISLDTLYREIPEGTGGCGYGSISINPKYNEVSFRRGCDDGHSYAIQWIGVFNYETYDFQLLDSLIGFNNCSYPIYAPDGLRIAFIANGELHIMHREIQDEK